MPSLSRLCFGIRGAPETGGRIQVMFRWGEGRGEDKVVRVSGRLVVVAADMCQIEGGACWVGHRVALAAGTAGATA